MIIGDRWCGGILGHGVDLDTLAITNRLEDCENCESVYGDTVCRRDSWMDFSEQRYPTVRIARQFLEKIHTLAGSRGLCCLVALMTVRIVG